MKSGRPELIVIDHDDYQAKHIGKTKSGLQFFLTTPFEPATSNSTGCEYIALFKFDDKGNLVDSIIDSLGPRDLCSDESREEKYSCRLNSLGDVNYGRIIIKPFSVKYNGVDVGLIVQEPEDEEDIWAVEMQPGNYMAFFEPWDSGEYDT